MAGISDTVCTDCSAGNVPSTSQSVCVACLPGFASPAPTTPCATCNVGQYSTGGDAICLICGPGSNTNTLTAAGASMCTPCSPDQFAASSSSACAACPDGSTPDVPSYGNDGSSSCTSCGAGYYFVGADQTCVPSKCAAIENLGQHQVVLGSSCFENGVQAASQMPASSCILGCLDGYSATNIAAGICTADEGLPTASYQGQNVDCVPSQCTAPLITPPQVSIARPDAFLVSCDNILNRAVPVTVKFLCTNS